MEGKQQQIEHLKGVYGGALTEGELVLLMRIQLLFRNVIEAKRGFNMVIEIVATKLHHVIRANLDVTVRTNVDLYLFEKSMDKDSPLLRRCEKIDFLVVEFYPERRSEKVFKQFREICRKQG